MIEFHNITRSYGRKLALNGLELTVKAGELFALLGPNGAGKTTAIKLLTGLLRPDSGGVTVCGHDLTHDGRNAAQAMGYVPDEPFLYDKLSGREFLQFAAEIRGLKVADAADAIERETKNFEMAEFLDSLIETYSHGMRQRLAFASALLHAPRVLVIDEPMVGLDPRSVRMVKDLLRRHAAAGMTIFMSTHTLAMAEEIADRIGILDGGRLQFLGTLSELQRELSSHHASLEALFLQLTEGEEEEQKKEEG
ncbi:MAG: ABC transporter ATP-binding protein [Pirellulales bacterium]|nr:ABC transporter ATP-binding protein [Pirellulales bacterium]